MASAVTTTPKTVTCKDCGQRPVAPSRIRCGRYACTNCIQNRPGAKAAAKRYRQSAKGRQVQRKWRTSESGKRAWTRSNRKRVFAAGQVFYVPQHTDAVRAHVKRRVAEFRQRQTEATCHFRETLEQSKN